MAILVAVLVVAFLVSRSCASQGSAVDPDEAVEVARDSIDFTATGVQVRSIPRGLKRRVWVVRLHTGPATAPYRCRLVEVDSETADVVAVRRC